MHFLSGLDQGRKMLKDGSNENEKQKKQASHLNDLNRDSVRAEFST